MCCAAVMSRTYRVVAWSTGNVGRHVIAGIDARPDLELTGVWVSNPDKVGKDAGELAGLGRALGVAASDDADALLALRPDCIVHTAWPTTGCSRRSRICRRCSGPASTSCPAARCSCSTRRHVPDEMSDPVEQAAAEGGVSMFVNGIDPGFANDAAARPQRSAERIDEVRCAEILNYATYEQPQVLSDIMGFGKPLDDTPFLLQPGVLGWRGAASSGRSPTAWRRAGRIRGVVRAGHPRPSTSPTARSRRAPRPACASRCRA